MLQDQPRNKDADAQADPTNETPEEEGNTLEGRLNLLNVIQQNAVIITGHAVKRGQPEPEESKSERWL